MGLSLKPHFLFAPLPAANLKFKNAGDNVISFNHKGHKEKAQRSQRNNNQFFTSVHLVIPIAIGTLCTLWLKLIFSTSPHLFYFSTSTNKSLN